MITPENLTALAMSEGEAYTYWFGGHFAALIIALPLFLRLYRQRRDMTWTNIVREDWQWLLFLLVAFICFVGAFNKGIEAKYPAPGLVAHLMSFGATALFTLYFFVAPMLADFASQWKKRTAAWALFALIPGPGTHLLPLLLPEAKRWPTQLFRKRTIPKAGKGVWIQVAEEQESWGPIRPEAQDKLDKFFDEPRELYDRPIR